MGSSSVKIGYHVVLGSRSGASGGEGSSIFTDDLIALVDFMEIKDTGRLERSCMTVYLLLTGVTWHFPLCF